VPWRSNGDYYSFKEEAIKFHAPPISGVYGLFNFKHHILIGSTDNIRESLLRHARYTDFHFRRFEPTGFTFEACPNESRDLRYQELVWEYDPIVQSESDRRIGFAALWRSWRTPEARAFHPQQTVIKKLDQSATTPIETRPTETRAAKRFQFDRERLGLAGAICGVIFVGFGIFGAFSYVKSSAGSLDSALSLLAQYWSSAPKASTQVAALTPSPEVATFPESSAPETSAVDPDRQLKTPQTNDIVRQPLAANNPAPATPPKAAPVPQENKPSSPPVVGAPSQQPQTAKPATRENIWAVQTMATTDKPDAQSWVSRLKAKGYDAFAVEAEIKGQIWYRVRVGAFASRQDAEVLRAALSAQEGFRDAFVAAGNKSDTILAANRR
jgi:cell division septation protein DedD